MSTPLPAFLPVAGLSPSLHARVAKRVAASQDPLARLRSGAALELYYEAGDPHSQLCAELARRWLPRLQLPLRIRLVPASDPSTYPEEARQRLFAGTDASRLAPCHDLPAPLAMGEHQRAALQGLLAASGDDAAAFLAAEQQALATLRSGRSLPADAQPARTQALMATHAARRQRLNHYLPAMWQYRGEWFWALDRLDFLEDRLRARGVLQGEAPLAHFKPDALQLPAPTPTAPLEFWFSFRSPYSYLAAVELQRQHAQGLWPQLQVRPVLPMVMRGLPVPRAKRLYIVRDVKRRADRLGIPFGRIHDPVGTGALRLLTLFPYSADTATQLRYAAIAGQTVWAEGLDTCRDDVMRSIYARSGLDWEAGARKLAAGLDTRQAELNREALFGAGLWGVPSFRWGEFTTWGQDRLWMLERLGGS